MGVGDDLAALGIGRLGQAAFVDQKGRLFLCLRDDALGLLLRLLDDPLAFRVDPLGGADLFGDGNAQFVDEAEGSVLIDYDVGRERQLLAVGDQRFKPFDEKDDVDRSVLQAAPAGSLRMSASIARGTSVSVPRELPGGRRSRRLGSSS